MKRIAIYVTVVLAVALGIYFISDHNTKVEEEHTNISDSNTFYYDAYCEIDTSSNVISDSHLEDGTLYISERLITIDRGEGKINYVIDQMIYNEKENTYLFRSKKTDILFDPVNRTLTILSYGIQFQITHQSKATSRFNI
jgi:hypothetical protein